MSALARNFPSAPTDTRNRSLRDLRISVTDRCNLRCTYCMPAELFGPDHAFLPRSEILDYEEIAKVVRSVTPLGVSKLRVTGGEPLLRRDLDQLIELLTKIDGVEDIALTTNAVVLTKMAEPLRAAGLSRLTISLDALDDTIFRAINGNRTGVAEVLTGINAAKDAGFNDIKINCVVQRGVNDDQVLPMVDHFRGSGIIIRFIEFMDVGNSNGWQLEKVVPSRELRERIHARFPLEGLDANYAGEVATRYRFADDSGEIGFISSVTKPFCNGCHRMRLSAKGELYTCLFASEGTDVRELIRSGANEQQLARFVTNLWRTRNDRYSEIRSEVTFDGERDKVEMSYIGG